MMIEIPITRREPIMRWVPVDERLPEHSGYFITSAVIVRDEDGRPDARLVKTQWYDKERDAWHDIRPDAWMPLPDPYTGGEA